MSKLIKSIAVLSLFTTLSAFATSTLPMVKEKGIPGCGIEIFKGYTDKQGWTVRNCLFSEDGKNYIEHTTQTEMNTKILSVVVPVKDSISMHHRIPNTELTGHILLIRRAGRTISVAKMTNKDGYTVEAGLEAAETSTGKSAFFKLEPMMIRMKMNNIDGKYDLSDFGIPLMASGVLHKSKTAVLAPER